MIAAGQLPAKPIAPAAASGRSEPSTSGGRSVAGTKPVSVRGERGRRRHSCIRLVGCQQASARAYRCLGMASLAGSEVRLAELIGSMSLATDLGLGQPMEHVLRSCVLGLRIAEDIGLEEPER